MLLEAYSCIHLFGLSPKIIGRTLIGGEGIVRTYRIAVPLVCFLLLFIFTFNNVSAQTDLTCSIIINGEAKFTTSTSVVLELNYTDQGKFGAKYVRYSNDDTWDTEPWEAPSPTKLWTLEPGDGTKTVYYQVSAASGALSNTASATIVLDTKAPEGSLEINGGAAQTQTTAVYLTLTATDQTSGVAQMRLSNDPLTDTTPWEPYTATKPWNISDQQGEHTVYVQYKDNAGLVSEQYTATIIFLIPTPTPSPTPAPTPTPTPTPTMTPSPTPEPTTPSPTPGNTSQPTPTPSPSLKPSPSTSPQPTSPDDSPSPEPSPTANPTPTPTPTPAPTDTPTPTPTPTTTPTPTPLHTPQPTPNQTPATTPQPTLSPAASATPEPSPTAATTATPTATPKPTPAQTPQVGTLTPEAAPTSIANQLPPSDWPWPDYSWIYWVTTITITIIAISILITLKSQKNPSALPI